MNTLLPNSIRQKLHSWEPFKEGAAFLASENCPKTTDVFGIKGSLSSFFLAEYFEANKAFWLNFLKYNRAGYSSQATRLGSDKEFTSGCAKILAVVPSERDAETLRGDLETNFPEATVTVIPSWGTLPYRSVNTGNRIFGKRAGALSKLVSTTMDAAESFQMKPQIFITSERVCETPLPPPEYIKSFIFSLKKGDAIDTQKIAEKLTSIGYTRVPKVGLPGEFSLRGEVLDIYLPAEELAVRIVFDFDTIEEIKTFEPDTQTTVKKLESVLVYPMKEIIWDEKHINILEEKLKDSDGTNPLKLPFTDEAKKSREKLFYNLRTFSQSEGEEIYYPLLWEKHYSIFDYIDKNTKVFYLDYDRISNSAENTARELTGMYRKVRQEEPVLPPEELYFSFEETKNFAKNSVRLRTLVSDEDEKSVENSNKEDTNDSEDLKVIQISAEPAQSFFGNINFLKEQLENLQNEDWKVCIFADNENQALRIKEILKDFSKIEIYGEAISEGFSIPDIKLRVIQENEIFGRRKYVPKSLHKAKSQVIDTFVELNPGDYVVHVNYGIGLFKGIERVKSMGNERDYIKLEYADQDFVFVPIEQVNMVQRYIGSEGEKPALDKLGSKAWENRKNKVKKAVEDLAQKLIGLYSRRKASRGFPFPKDTEWQTTFEAAFPYEDTPDQITVTKEIKEDMEKTVPMDRLLCGDVGYGKTEIAMRAAFKAVMGGKQVAFLAPTTILAEQHFESCEERFRNFPVKIAHMSRFVSQTEQKKILSALKEGQIDILVGTHRIIQKDVVFKNLGLMIIDEEQRFGVKDKEKLKEMKNNIDCLAMSATPIPRTLHMSLLKIRDMSLLTTPPQIRKPIETIIDEYSDEKVCAAIRKEVERGGQVFFLHNRVESLNEIRLKLERLMPEMMIDVAHGQMTSDELDDIFRRFKMGGFHVLVATTIIENGIDIPNVNTIIIDRADMYGISQLYQLRGRVGRSDRKAYAYMLYPENKSLSEIAMKRLQVISDFTELGSGFKIAMKDMEIRGAGNLLGRDQSGSVYSVGFDMYMRLLNDAVNHLVSQEDYKSQTETLLELEYSGFIPETYVQNPQTKMEIYKKIAAVETRNELDGVVTELLDRFGPIPDEVSSLLSLAEIRILCKKLNVASIKERQGLVYVDFARVSDISIDKVLRLIAEAAGNVRLDASNPSRIILNAGKIGLREKSEFIRENLERIA